MDLFVLFITVFILIILYMGEKNLKKHKENLLLKYGDAELVEKLLRGHIWQGQTEEQLLDSIGRPMDVDQKILKTKKKETWKYDSVGKNRYRLKIVIENGIVVGWEKK